MQQQPPYQTPQQPLGGIPSLAGAARGNTQGRRLPLGDFVVEITALAVNPNHQGQPFFVREFNVLESNNAAVAVGDAYSQASAFTDQWGYGPRDIKGFLCDLIEAKIPGTDPMSEWQDAFITWAVDASQPAAGTRWAVNVWEKPKKNSQGMAEICDWSPMQPGETRGLVPVAQVPAAVQPAPVAAPQPGAGYVQPAQPQATPQGMSPQLAALLQGQGR
jgi:hypothetical protein